MALALAAAGLSLPASAQLLPSGFFDLDPKPGATAAVEASMLAYNANTTVISAEGGVIMNYDGYEIRAEKLSYNQTTGEALAEGKVRIRDPLGSVYEADRIQLTGGMKQAFIDSLVLTTSKGARIEATDVEYANELQTILTDASYSPCGLCIDSKGRRIGWKVNASKLVYDKDSAQIYLEGAGLEILGVPMAWVPWLVLPDPTQRRQGFRTPSVDYEDRYGARLDVPYFVPIGNDIDLMLTPSLMSRQGLLMGAEWTHRFPLGEYDIKASGLYQLDPSAYAGTVGAVDWRGAIQTTGRFTPLEDWKAGWSYTLFSDAQYLKDYKLQSSDNVVNEVYATYLTRDYYLDVRARQFNRLGNYTAADQDRQASQIPRIEAASYHDLGEYGRIELSAEVTGVMRRDDHTATFNGVPYVFGYEENKVHGTFQAAWQDQYIVPGGVALTPYLGLRLDAGHYDGASALLAGPVSLLDATPIAAIDVRWPLIALDGDDSHIFEPVAQLVYRGSSTTLTGITNDNAQSFVFDDTLLFSYDRFSGTDRQETGLRANIGGRYVANFADGSWFEAIGGQSFHLAGANALGVVDAAQTGNASGLENTASYMVGGVQASLFDTFRIGAKTQFDPNSLQIMRAAAAASTKVNGYDLGLAYTYIAANPAVGTIADQHEATASVSGPLFMDYWFGDASVSWDLATNNWLEAGAGVTYDDGYFAAGLFGKVNGPTHSSPNAVSWGFKFRLRGPDGEWGY